MSAKPKTALIVPAIALTPKWNFSVLFEITKGRLNSTVINAIDITVPTPNKIKYPNPTKNESIVANKASITAALPAMP